MSKHIINVIINHKLYLCVGVLITFLPLLIFFFNTDREKKKDYRNLHVIRLTVNPVKIKLHKEENIYYNISLKKKEDYTQNAKTLISINKHKGNIHK